MITKYIYVPTTHGNYVIIKVPVKPSLDANNEVECYILQRARPSRPGQYVAGLKGSYKPLECFDTEDEAIKYASDHIKSHRQSIINKLEASIKERQDKIEKLLEGKPRVRYFNWVD